MNAGNESIEDIILRHSQRGMQLLRAYVPDRWCHDAAAAIFSWRKTTGSNVVFLATGFYVAGFAETDGPAGTLAVAAALKKLGFRPVILTDLYCKGFFEPEGLEVVYVPLPSGNDFAVSRTANSSASTDASGYSGNSGSMGRSDSAVNADSAAGSDSMSEAGSSGCLSTAYEQYFRELFIKYQPAGMIAIERCGENIQHDYANMRGISIREHTAPIDIAFDLAPHYGIPTVGVGDGGNEIGMGNVAAIITEKLSLVPCRNKVGHLVIASVSNWGAYGIAAYLQLLSGQPVFPSSAKICQFIKDTVAIGSVDGITHERINHVDGFDASVEAEIIDALHHECTV